MQRFGVPPLVGVLYIGLSNCPAPRVRLSLAAVSFLLFYRPERWGEMATVKRWDLREAKASPSDSPLKRRMEPAGTLHSSPWPSLSSTSLLPSCQSGVG